MFLGAVLLAGTVNKAVAEDIEGRSVDPDTVKTRPLRILMVQLAQDMRRISDGIWHEDYIMIKKGAAGIAHHPRISPAQMKSIKQALGNRFPQFVQIDKQVHHTAVEMVSAAKRKQMGTILEHYGTLQQGCVACHSGFREEVRDALYRDR